MGAERARANRLLAVVANSNRNSDLRADHPDVIHVVEMLLEEIADLKKKLDTPELVDFSRGVISEAQHQRAAWGSDHDAGKSPEDWFWLLGYLGGKALAAYKRGDTDKALHHTISSAAALANWHAAILGQTNMRPGIDPAEHGLEGVE